MISPTHLDFEPEQLDCEERARIVMYGKLSLKYFFTFLTVEEFSYQDICIVTTGRIPPDVHNFCGGLLNNAMIFPLAI